jgi:PDDEXK-like uncharacterized protein DUF3799
LAQLQRKEKNRGEEKMRKPGIYNDINIDVYHNDEGISSTGISLILDCPRRYWHEYLSGQAKDRNGKQFDVGQALHTAVLEPEKFKERFHLSEESYDLRTKVGKETLQRIEGDANGRTILRGSDCEMIMQMEAAIKEHDIWKEIKLSDGHVENSIYWDAGIYNTRLRARPDFFNDTVIVDLKTTDSIAGFDRSVYNYGYHRQAAMQMDGLEAIDGKKRHFAFFLVEKKAPYLTECITLPEEWIELGRKQYLEGAITYSECLQSNSWPGYNRKVRLLSMPKWLTSKEEQENV